MTIQQAMTLKAKFWEKVAHKVVKMIKMETMQGKGADGNFPKYKNSYAKQKAKGTGRRQGNKQVNPPNLRYSGDMMRDLKKLHHDKYGMKVGWASFGKRVEFNADRKRPISTEANPASKTVQNYVFGRFQAAMMGNLRKATKVTKLTIGK